MIYNEEPGIVYDMIYFNINYFNEDAIRQWQTDSGSQTDPFVYQSALQKKITPPKQFFPLFYLDENGNSLFTSYLNKYFYHNTTVQTFLKSIQDESKLKRFIYFYFGEPVKDKINFDLFMKNDAETLSKYFLQSALPQELLTELPKLFYHFEQLIRELVEYFTTLTQKVRELREENRRRIEAAKNDFSTSQFRMYLRHRYNLKEALSLDDQVYSVCLVFNTCFMLNSDAIKERFCFLLGVDVERPMESLAYLKNAEPCLLGSALLHPVKNAILHQLRICEQTGSQLSDELNVARTSIARHLTELCDGMFIKPSKRAGHEIYYTLNLPFIEAAEEFIMREFNVLLQDNAQQTE